MADKKKLKKKLKNMRIAKKKDWKDKKIKGWSGRYDASYNDMSKAIEGVSHLRHDLKKGGSVKQAVRRQKLRRKHGYDMEYVDGGLSVMKKYLRKKLKKMKIKHK